MAEFTLHASVVSTHLEEKGWSVRGINEIGWYRGERVDRRWVIFTLSGQMIDPSPFYP
jgi:hypothetical protein